MIVAKEDEVVLVLDDRGVVQGDACGVFRRDTRFLSEWRWEVADSQILSTQEVTHGLRQHVAVVDRRRVQQVGLDRRITVRADGFDERWTIENTSLERREVALTLQARGEFKDIMARWLEPGSDPEPPVQQRREVDGFTTWRVARDGVETRATVRVHTGGRVGEGLPLTAAFDLAPGQRVELVIEVDVTASDASPPSPLPTYAAWRAAFTVPPDTARRPAFDRAVEDLRMLLLSTPRGPYPAAGTPWFVAMFGRDALITAHMLLEWRPELAASVLRTLAAEQGRVHDPFTEEAPGKILHEIRRGELSRTRRIPFGRYYGSIDATPLFVMLLGAYAERTGDGALVRELRPAWAAAVDFITRHQGDGLLAFDPSGSGLGVQSWKDSSDSMNHADGTPAQAPLAVVEVQAYAVAALRAAAGLHRTLGEPALAEALCARADTLAAALHARFWMEDLGTYAMALDRDGRPLRVLSSDAAHLLWCGVVPEGVAPRVVETLMGEALWSGWGLRTLGAGERRYNPVSYHNGGVWPHDTAIFAGGLSRYGFARELDTVAAALFDLAAHQPLHRMPELISGFPREPRIDPVPYTHACRPQAWAAAALPYVSGLTSGAGRW